MRWLTILALLALANPLLAQPAEQPPALAALWQNSRDDASHFTLHLLDDGTYRGNAKCPGTGVTYRVTVTKRPNRKKWDLVADRLVDGHVGATGRLDGEDYVPTHWDEGAVEATLRRRGKYLKSRRDYWIIGVPREVPSEVLAAKRQPEPEPEPADEPETDPEPQDLPVVKVLITGFDRFPRPKNHPKWINRSSGEPGINPAGWMVREFQLSDLGEEFSQEVRIELHKCLDVPVVYREGARVIRDKIAEVQPDVVISFGVGSNSGADADVETTCENLMDDSDIYDSDEKGPHQLPADWPPGDSRNRSDWSDEDRAWLMRYPDNAGVSYNGAKIDPAGPEKLTSLLPVDAIVERVKSENLRGIDGGWGPGRYICNNVMYEVIQEQTARGKLGGFIHVNSWSESRRAKYIKTLKCAIEESAKAWLARQQPELPAEQPVVGVPAPEDRSR